MFTRLGPQRVRHESGYVVQFAGREAVEHVHNGRTAVFVIDVGSPGYPATLYVRRVTWKDGGVPTEDERRELAEQVRAGMNALDDLPVEVTED